MTQITFRKKVYLIPTSILVYFTFQTDLEDIKCIKFPFSPNPSHGWFCARADECEIITIS